jgi:hypothetical protein
MNVHWMVLYKLYAFCSDMKFNMAATTGLSLTLDPMGKMFQNAFFPIGSNVNLCPAVAAILNFRSAYKKHKLCRGPSNDYSSGHRLALDPKGKCSNAFFSETTNIIKAKLYMNVHWMVL